MIFSSEKSLRKACKEFLAHYHGVGNHQGLDNSIIEPSEEVGQHDGEIDQIEVKPYIGGLIKSFERKAA